MRALVPILLVAALLGPRPGVAQDRPNPAGATHAGIGDPAAAQLCSLAFNARGDGFDAAGAAEGCGRAAARGDAAALRRAGLLALAGVGTARDLDAAARNCRAASAKDASGTGFCLAAIAEERRRTGDAEAAAEPARAPALDPASAATVSAWLDRARRGDHAGASRLCETYFEAGPAGFDPAEAAAWCRRATGYGDPQAMQRLGLMRIWAVGMERSLPQARALCTEAQRRDPAVSAGFCVAAVEADVARTTGASLPQHPPYPQPWPAATDPAQLAVAMAPDRVLETLHGTSDGPRFNCRELIRWARYGPTMGGIEFGRPILQYREQDFATLDAGAASCAAEITPYDPDGSERGFLADFRRMLPELKARKRQLAADAATTRADQARFQELGASGRTFSVIEAALSPQQRQCIDAIRADWSTHSFDPGAQAIEIRTASTTQVAGATVVTGSAQVIEDPLENRASAETYSCTFDKSAQIIIDKTILPQDQPQLPALHSQ